MKKKIKKKIRNNEKEEFNEQIKEIEVIINKLKQEKEEK